MKDLAQWIYNNTRLGKSLHPIYLDYIYKKERKASLENKYGKEFLKKFKKNIAHKSDIDLWFLTEYTHGNTGDIAIRYSESVFFEKTYPKFGKHYVYTDIYQYYSSEIKKQIRKNDIIVLSGGGNIGDLYISYENLRRNIIEEFPNNLIISMPQTCFFSNTRKGHDEKLKSQKIYNTHNKLVLMARDEISYAEMKKIFYRCSVELAPDIVMTQNFVNPLLQRKGVTLCFREDSEVELTEVQRDEIEDVCRKYFSEIKKVPMRASDEVCLFENSLKYVKDKIDKFKSSELVITDRLHGMIFCAISGTPCIALPSYNHKISATSMWLNDCSYVRFINNMSELEKCLCEMIVIKEKHHVYNDKFFIDRFDFLFKYLAK